MSYQQIGGSREENIAYVEKTDTASRAIAKGKYVIWKGSVYQASTAISAGATLSTNNLTAKPDGVANELADQIVTINSRILTMRSFETPNGTYVSSANFGTAYTNRNAVGIYKTSSGVVLASTTVSAEGKATFSANTFAGGYGIAFIV